MLVSSLFELPDDLLEAVVGWAWSTRELARLAASHSRFRHIVRRLLRDRSHPVWRQLCANAGGGAVFDGVADYPSLYFKMRRLTPPRIRAIDSIQFIVQVHQLVADTEGGESSELVFSELLHGNVATGSWFDGEELEHAFGFKWRCQAAAKLPTVDRFQLEAINSDGDFPSTEVRARWTPEQIANRAGQCSWQLSLTGFNASSQARRLLLPPPERSVVAPHPTAAALSPRPAQTVYHLLEDAPPRPDFSAMGGPGGWSTENFSFQHQPLRFVASADGPQGQYGHMLTHDWHAHASLVPPPAGEDGSTESASATWELHLHVTAPQQQADDWDQQPADFIVTALENLHCS